MPDRSNTVSTLRRRADFDRVFGSGRRRRVGGITVILAKSPESGVRYGVVAGRKIGGAVERNRVKRRIRHALAAIQIPNGTDLVVIASPAVATTTFTQLVEWLASVIEADPRVHHDTEQEKPGP